MPPAAADNGESSSSHVRKYVTTEVQKLMKKSKVLDAGKEAELPHFFYEELKQGKRLGSGMFGTVYQLDAANVKDDPADERDEDQIDACNFIRDTAVREKDCEEGKGGEARYAIKILNKDVVDDPNMFLKGSLDLAMEAKFLSNFIHPNIVKVRGAGVDHLLGNEKYFIMMDRLYDTLENRMETWKKTQKKLSGIGAIRKKEEKKDFLLERLNVAFEMSAALSYIHQKNIVYRDLKPENLGFDIRGDIKIFDFGFAKELHDDMKQGADNAGGDLYNLTGKTGTLIYMAPEVVLMEPYSTKADVYSFAMMFWEFMALTEPFKKSTPRIHEKMVCRGSFRPPINKKWPAEVQELISKCWAKDIGARPSTKVVNLRLRSEVQRMKGGNESMDFTRRRSTFVFRGKNRVGK